MPVPRIHVDPATFDRVVVSERGQELFHDSHSPRARDVERALGRTVRENDQPYAPA